MLSLISRSTSGLYKYTSALFSSQPLNWKERRIRHMAWKEHICHCLFCIEGAIGRPLRWLFPFVREISRRELNLLQKIWVFIVTYCKYCDVKCSMITTIIGTLGQFLNWKSHLAYRSWGRAIQLFREFVAEESLLDTRRVVLCTFCTFHQ